MAAIIMKEKEKQKLQDLAKSGYWKNELSSLGVVEPNRWKELNDNKEELEYLADSIKQAMFEDYKLAYSEKGDEHREEAESTLTVG
ncbi:MAG TPA: hypothetical protein VGE97_10360 [Nitrososphaera sp.]|jgi:hypothetical protein